MIAGVTDAATLAAANLFSVVVFAMLCLSVVAVVAIVVVVVFLMLMMLMLTLRAVNVVFEDLVLVAVILPCYNFVVITTIEVVRLC